MKTCLLKIGGSVCTFKNKETFEVNEPQIAKIAEEIRKAREIKKFRLVLVHGVGPFGHLSVKQFGLTGVLTAPEKIKGLVTTHNRIRSLNQLLQKIFLEEGLLPFLVQPSCCFLQEERKLAKSNLTLLDRLFETSPEIIPVFHGDMVPDLSYNFSVISGDLIVPVVAEHLGAERILLGSDVEGVYKGDFKNRSPENLIREINTDNLETYISDIGNSQNTDVTGGMLGKILALKAHLKDKEAVVFSLKKEGVLFDLLTEKADHGTLIRF